MFSSVISGKLWTGLVAGVFGLAGLGTGLVALPAFADSSRSINLATASSLMVRLECQKGVWTDGSFTWTLAGQPVGTAVVLPACPQPGGNRFAVLPPITMPASGSGTNPVTGSATADGFNIKVSGKSASGLASATCAFPSPAPAAKLMRRHTTLTCTADGTTNANQAHMKVKIKAIGDDNSQAGNADRNEKNDKGNSGNNNGHKDKDKDKSENPGHGERRGWMNFLTRGRDS